MDMVAVWYLQYRTLCVNSISSCSRYTMMEHQFVYLCRDNIRCCHLLVFHIKATSKSFIEKIGQFLPRGAHLRVVLCAERVQRWCTSIDSINRDLGAQQFFKDAVPLSINRITGACSRTHQLSTSNTSDSDAKMGTLDQLLSRQGTALTAHERLHSGEY